MSIWRLLGFAPAEEKKPPEETDTVRKIVNELNQMERDRARYVACFSYLLGRVAHADLDISPEEVDAMEKILVEIGGLPRSQAILVAQMARTQNELFGATEDFLVAREFGKLAGPGDKMRLLECLFAVSAADQSITAVEDNEIHRISKELGLKHPDFIAARLAYKDYLASKKKPSS